MPYQFATERQDYSDLSSGRVLYSLPGHPAFPIRLTSEIFQRCLAARRARGLKAPPVIYDPCCGSAYHLVTLAYLHWDAIGRIIASDIDPEALCVAQRNLGLLTLAGLDQRIQELAEMQAAYGKASHTAAIDSARRLKKLHAFQFTEHALDYRLFLADATCSATLLAELGDAAVDVVISDVPYGRHSTWQLGDPPTSPEASSAPPRPPLWRMLDALQTVLRPTAIVAIASDKGQRVAHPGYQRVARFQIGKRQVVLIEPRTP